MTKTTRVHLTANVTKQKTSYLRFKKDGVLNGPKNYTEKGLCHVLFAQLAQLLHSFATFPPSRRVVFHLLTTGRDF